MADLIDRQAAIDAIEATPFDDYGDYIRVRDIIDLLPSAQPEPLTDKEQRIFLAAMGREEKVCKEVDEEYKDLGESCDVNLVMVCREIERKVKKVLWAN